MINETQATPALAGRVNTQAIRMLTAMPQRTAAKPRLTPAPMTLAVMQWVRDRMMEVLGRAAAQGHDPLDALQRMFFAHIEFIAGHPAIPRVLTSSHLHGRNAVLRQLVTEIMLGYEAKIAGLLSDAQTQGLARADLDTQAAATLYIGMIQGLVLQSSILRGQRVLEKEAARTFPVYLQAIRPQST